MSADNSEKSMALEMLGWELSQKGWKPSIPIAEPFELSGDAHQKQRVRLGWSFLQINKSKIREAVCKEKAPKIEITTSTSTFAAIADALIVIGGFPVPVSTVANAVLTVGVHKFCEG